MCGEMSGCLSGQSKVLERWKEPIVIEPYSTSRGSVQLYYLSLVEGDSSIVRVTEILDFGGHSTGSTSTSKAELSGLFVKEVLD